MRGWGNATGLDLTGVDPAYFDRFWSKLDKNGPKVERSRCWVWVGGSGTKSQAKKDPQWSVPGIGIKLCRQVLYALEHDRILPPDLIMAQACDTHRCLRHWDALPAKEARRRINRRITTLPVDEIRAHRLAGASCASIAEEFQEVGHDRVRRIIGNKSWIDDDFYSPLGGLRQEHPERCRFTEEQIEEIRAEHATGTPLLRIAKWLGAPTVTVWEAANGPSAIKRRKVAA